MEIAGWRLKSQLAVRERRTVKSTKKNCNAKKIEQYSSKLQPDVVTDNVHVGSVCLCLLNHMFDSHSCCRLSYRRPSTWTAMSWLCLTTCSYITIPSMGEGLADSTLQKVRLLIWRMVGTFFCILLFAALLHLCLQTHPSFSNTPPIFFYPPPPPKDHTPASNF